MWPKPATTQLTPQPTTVSLPLGPVSKGPRPSSARGLKPFQPGGEEQSYYPHPHHHPFIPRTKNNNNHKQTKSSIQITKHHTNSKLNSQTRILNQFKTHPKLNPVMPPGVIVAGGAGGPIVDAKKGGSKGGKFTDCPDCGHPKSLSGYCPECHRGPEAGWSDNDDDEQKMKQKK